MEPTRESQSSVEVSRNSSGAILITVKCYSPDPIEAKKKSQEIFDEMVKKYPHQQRAGVI